MMPVRSADHARVDVTFPVCAAPGRAHRPGRRARRLRRHACPARPRPRRASCTGAHRLPAGGRDSRQPGTEPATARAGLGLGGAGRRRRRRGHRTARQRALHPGRRRRRPALSRRRRAVQLRAGGGGRRHAHAGAVPPAAAQPDRRQRGHPRGQEPVPAATPVHGQRPADLYPGRRTAPARQRLLSVGAHRHRLGLGVDPVGDRPRASHRAA